MKNKRSFKNANLFWFPGIVIFTILLSGCNFGADEHSKVPGDDVETAVPVEERISVPDSITEFLLNSAATDFHSSNISRPTGFREVKVGFVMLPNQARQYVLCGQFLGEEQENENEWMSFATIKTSPYEHWVGRQAGTFCDDPELMVQEDKDLSSVLKSKLDAL